MSILASPCPSPHTREAILEPWKSAVTSSASSSPGQGVNIQGWEDSCKKQTCKLTLKFEVESTRNNLEFTVNESSADFRLRWACVLSIVTY